MGGGDKWMRVRFCEKSHGVLVQLSVCVLMLRESAGRASGTNERGGVRLERVCGSGG